MPKSKSKPKGVFATPEQIAGGGDDPYLVAQVPGLSVDGEPALIRYRSSSAKRALALLDTADKERTTKETVTDTIDLLSEMIVNASGEPLFTTDQLWDLPLQTINQMASVLVFGGDEGED